MRTATWNPWKDLERLHSDVSRLFGDRAWDRTRAYPAVNVHQGENELYLTAEIPGLNPEALDITVNPQSVTLKADRKPVELKEGEAWSRKERPDASINRTVELPFAVDPQSAEAKYEKGVLTIRLNRPMEHRPNKVQVRAG
ncbi:MAG: Hsp20/alpha crystallin family protein [Planctomycetaceae bacterium]|nr:Hsp20/alpha crystallin family protein [Planctomycetaceae bacterium]